MKFWQKLFLYTLILFMLAFDAGAYILTTQAYDFNRKREAENGIREQSVILSSVTGKIRSVETIYADAATSKERLDAILSPLADYYAPQGVLLALYNEDSLICSNIPAVDDGLLQLPDADHKRTLEAMLDGKRYLLVSSALPDYPHLTLVYARDISQADAFRREISKIFLLVTVSVTILLGAAIYLLLRHLTRPIDALNQMTAEIAGGAYDKRVALHRTDEFASLEKNFNLMADSVEQNIAHLARAAEDRQQFIDDLTHEMKTPMTSILGYTDYLQNAKATEEERQIAAAHLHDAALRLKNLSDKLLDLAFLRGEAITQNEITQKKVNIPALFSALTDAMQPLLAGRDLSLHTDATLTELQGDEILLLSMLTNLVENAAKASSPGDTITVRAYREDVPVLEVSDMGHGMMPEEIARITAPFYRVDKSRSRQYGGVGLGLSIVSQIAALHHGQLSITSAPGAGTTVRIFFFNM